MREIDGIFSIRTVENIDLEFQIAGIGSRIIAYLIDSLIRFLYVSGLIALSFLITGMAKGMNLNIEIIFFSGYIFILITFLGYFPFFEWVMDGQTPGKRLIGIRVIGNNGERLRFFPCLIRNIMRIPDSFPFAYSLGVVIMLLHPRQCRLGDILANTFVVYEEKQTLWPSNFLPPLPVSDNLSKRIKHYLERMGTLDITIKSNIAYSLLSELKTISPEWESLINKHVTEPSEDALVSIFQRERV